MALVGWYATVYNDSTFRIRNRDMDLNFTEEQEMLRASARDFLEKECPESIVREIERSDLGYSPDLWKKIADLGWLGLVYPEQYGGTGMNVVDLAVLYEEFGRAMFPSPYISTIVMSGLTILEAGNDEQKSDILLRVIKGDTIIALALSEPGSSWEGTAWNPESVTISATPDGDGYLLDGVQRFVHDANIASIFLVPARTRASGYPKDGITLFLAGAESPGISVARLATIAGDNQCEVIFSKVRVPRENIIGKLNGGWAPLSRSMQIGTVMLSAQMLGAGQRLLELSVEDYETRIQSDMPGEVKQYNEEYLAHLRNDIDGCRGTIYLAAKKLANGEPCDFEMTVVQGWSSYIHEKASSREHQGQES
jgi:alkylation response protein AidB-like acyl-CoA dehydrogenase